MESFPLAIQSVCKTITAKQIVDSYKKSNATMCDTQLWNSITNTLFDIYFPYCDMARDKQHQNICKENFQQKKTLLLSSTPT